MTDLAYGDILVGGEHGKFQVLRGGVSQGTFDAHDDIGNGLRVNGISVLPSGDLLFALGDPAGTQDNNPHDVVALPSGKGLLALVARTTPAIELWEVAPDGTVGTKHTGLSFDTGWDPTTDYLKLDVLCDGKTVYYTDCGKTIFQWDAATHTQLAAFDVLPDGSPYVYAAFKLTRGGGLVVAKTVTGNGPRNAVCLDANPLYFWTDEINPTSSYHVYKRLLSDGSEVSSAVPDLDPGQTDTSGPITALGCWVRICQRGTARAYFIG